MTARRLPLEGVRVLALEQYISGPYCTMWLADAGAEVIKIERPGVGDPRRNYLPAKDGENGAKVYGGFFAYNRNKKSVAIDLQQEEGRKLYRSLAATADVIVENLKPGAVEKLGIGYEDLRKDNAGLVYAGISGYGRDPSMPLSNRLAFDSSILAMSGITELTGIDPDGPPEMPMYALADMFTGVVTGYQILMALFDRSRTNEGRYLDVSMYDSTVALNVRPLMLYEFSGEVLERGPDRFQAPIGNFATSEGYISIVIPNDAIWGRLCRCIGRGDLITGELTATGPARAENPEAYRSAIESWMAKHTRAEAIEALESYGVPAGAVQNAADVAHCPHLEARGMFVRVQDPDVGEIRMPRAPLAFNDMPDVPAGTAPRVGQHTSEILKSLLGLTPDDLAKYATDGVVTAPGLGASEA